MKWTSLSGYTPLLSEPRANAPKMNGININPSTVLDMTGRVSGEYEEVVYRGWTGWVKSERLEPYVETLAKNQVSLEGIQTVDPYDAEQYVTVKGKRQVNLCGEICVSYLLDASLPFLLERIEQTPKLWKSLFPDNVGRTTGALDLKAMFENFGVESHVLTYKQYTPAMLEKLCGRAIVSVRMNRATGELNGSGVGHWVVPLRVVQERMGRGLVCVYNPFPNREEVYSWREFAASAMSPYGVEL